MKSLLLIFMLINSMFAKDLTNEQKELAKKYITLSGYKCYTVTFGLFSSWDGKLHITCDDRYSYELKDTGYGFDVRLK